MFRTITSKIPTKNAAVGSTSKNDNEPIAIKQIKQQPLTLSDSCIIKLKKVCTDNNFLRIKVEGGGCSGFQYKFSLDNNINQDDIEFGDKEARVVIDNTSLLYCAGSTLDYHSELIKSGFRIIGNPQAEQGCSCGSSFAIKLD